MNDSLRDISLAVDRLRQGKLVAFPTETVYGLGADALNPLAVQSVFDLKGRPSFNPLIVHVSGVSMARPLVTHWSDHAELLARRFWPGPLTLILPKSSRVPDIVTASSPGVALRSPDHPLALALLFEFNSPIVGPSANRSGHVSPTTAAHVRAEFPDADLLILEGGDAAGRVGLESTVLSLLQPVPTILRPGCITPEQLSQTLNLPITFASSAAPFQHAPAQPLHSPGVLARHYAPRTPALLLTHDQILNELTRHHRSAVLARTISDVPAGAVLISMPSDPESYAARLYAELRQADALNLDRILIEAPPDDDELSSAHDRSIWHAIRDRLRRATSLD